MKELNKKIFRKNQESFSGNYDKCFFEQYKIYINSVHHNSNRRQRTNDFFLAVNTGLIAVLSIVNANLDKSKFLIATSTILGITICHFWHRLIKSYRMKNRGKFKVIRQIEKKLPLAIYSAEWDVLGKGKDPKKFVPFTVIELRIPRIFAIFYLVILFWSLGLFNF